MCGDIEQMDTWVPHETYLLSGDDHDFDINWGGFGTQTARAKPKHCLQQYGGR